MTSILPSQDSAANGTGLSVVRGNEFQLHVRPSGDSFIVQASDLASALGFRDGYTLVRSIPDDEKLTVDVADQLGRSQQAWFLTEPGFYRVLGQRQAARVRDDDVRERVERFQNWVYGEVLPAIRKAGHYETTPSTAPPLAIEAAVVAKAQLEAIGVARQYGLTNESFLDGVTWTLIARMTGDEPELDPSTITITCDQYLEDKAVSTKDLPSARTRLGMGVARRYREKYGKDPEKRLRYVDSRHLPVGVYTRRDSDLFDAAWRKISYRYIGSAS